MADIIAYLPDILQNIYEFKELATTENTELDSVKQELSSVVKDNFISTLTERGCKRWENMLGIIPKATDDIEVRRFRILSKLNEELPFTLSGLIRQLKLLCGENGVTVQLNNTDYTLTVLVALTAKNQVDEIDALLRREVPANIVTVLSLKYNRYSVLAARTHGELAPFTHEQLRNEVV